MVGADILVIERMVHYTAIPERQDGIIGLEMMPKVIGIQDVSRAGFRDFNKYIFSTTSPFL